LNGTSSPPRARFHPSVRHSFSPLAPILVGLGRARDQLRATVLSAASTLCGRSPHILGLHGNAGSRQEAASAAAPRRSAVCVAQPSGRPRYLSHWRLAAPSTWLPLEAQAEALVILHARTGNTQTSRNPAQSADQPRSPQTIGSRQAANELRG